MEKDLRDQYSVLILPSITDNLFKNGPENLTCKHSNARHTSNCGNQASTNTAYKRRQTPLFKETDFQRQYISSDPYYHTLFASSLNFYERRQSKPFCFSMRKQRCRSAPLVSLHRSVVTTYNASNSHWHNLYKLKIFN